MSADDGARGARTARFRPSRLLLWPSEPRSVLPPSCLNRLAFGSLLEQGYGPRRRHSDPDGLSASWRRRRAGSSSTPLPHFGFLASSARGDGRVRSRAPARAVAAWIAALVVLRDLFRMVGGRRVWLTVPGRFAPVMFAAIAWGTSVGMRGSRLARVVFGLLAAWSFVLFQAAASCTQDLGHVARECQRRSIEALQLERPPWLAVLPGAVGRRTRHRRRRP